MAGREDRAGRATLLGVVRAQDPPEAREETRAPGRGLGRWPRGLWSKESTRGQEHQHRAAGQSCLLACITCGLSTWRATVSERGGRQKPCCLGSKPWRPAPLLPPLCSQPLACPAAPEGFRAGQLGPWCLCAAPPCSCTPDPWLLHCFYCFMSFVFPAGP